MHAILICILESPSQANKYNITVMSQSYVHSQYRISISFCYKNTQASGTAQ